MEASDVSGNFIAYLAISVWPIVALILFRTMPVPRATLWTVLGAYMFLPSAFSIKIPMVPGFDKDSVPNLCVFVGCLVLAQTRRPRPAFGLVECLAVVFVCSPVVTSALNNDLIVIGDRILPGVGYYDGISALLSQLLLILSFFVGRRVFADAAGFGTIVPSVAVAGLIYSVPFLVEIRLSPQFSNWVYGYLPSGFLNEVRYGGYRPVVFMRNGLMVSFFLMTTFLAALTMWRLNDRIKSMSPMVTSVYLGAIIILCKSGGALIYSVVGGVMVRWSNSKTQLRVAVILAAIGLLYPVLRITDIFPDRTLLELASSIDQDRSDSLQVRFDQERQLLERASQRFAFGWGRYGRSRIYEESGKDLSITDGAWIITLGQFGLIGFASQFGLLAWPIFRAASSVRYLKSKRDQTYLAVIALIAALTVIEQLPNASISSWSWLIAGALLGRAEYIFALARRDVTQGYSKAVESASA